jgi:uncharacterized protein YrzB (UPF0473 family)
MDKLNEKEELIVFLSDSLPILSDHINQIVISMPKDLEDVGSEHLNSIKPKVKKMVSFTQKNLQQMSPIDSMYEDNEMNEIFKLYFRAISDILNGVEKLYSFLLNEEGSDMENIVIFIEKLYEGSKGIMELVDRVTE